MLGMVYYLEIKTYRYRSWSVSDGIISYKEELGIIKLLDHIIMLEHSFKDGLFKLKLSH